MKFWAQAQLFSPQNNDYLINKLFFTLRGIDPKDPLMNKIWQKKFFKLIVIKRLTIIKLKRNLHLCGGDDSSEDADEPEELVRVVVVDRVLETDLRDPEKKRPAQSQHVTDQTIFPWKKDYVKKFIIPGMEMDLNCF